MSMSTDGPALGLFGGAPSICDRCRATLVAATAFLDPADCRAESRWPRTMPMPPRASLFVFTGSRGVTGGFVAALREAQLLADIADVTLVVPQDSQFDDTATGGIRLLKLPFAQPRPTIGSVLGYPFRLFHAG